jgi:hypothetical protein
MLMFTCVSVYSCPRGVIGVGWLYMCFLNNFVLAYLNPQVFEESWAG